MIAERIALSGAEVELMRPRDAEALISEESFEHEEFLPYWAELWASAVALAHDVSMRSLRGRPTLELGCGLGLPSIGAALAGGRVLATDWSPDAVRATAANAERNDVQLETLQCAWAEPDAIVARAPWPLVLASDVLYEARNVELLLDLLPRLVDGTGLVLIADPGRVPAERFIAAALAGGHVLATDWSPDAVRATAANAERNDVELETLQCAWAEPDAIVARAPWPLVLASDVLYEARNVELLLDLLPRLVDETGLVMIADPGRVPAERFIAAAPKQGWTVRSVPSPRAKRVLIHRLRRTPSA